MGSNSVLETVLQPLIRSQATALSRRKGRNGNFCLNFSLILSFASTILFWFTDINEVILQKITLKEGSLAKELYVKPPINKIMKIHIFNYTNVDRFKAKLDKKLHVEEIGPFAYEEVADKVNVQFDESTMTFSENRSHHFLPHLSTKTSTDAILTMPNLLLISAIKNIIDRGVVARLAFRTISSITKPTEFERISVKDFLHGHSSSFSNGIRTVKWDFNESKIGFLSQRAGLSDRRVTVSTDAGSAGKIVKIDGKKGFNIWTSKRCNGVDGSDGVFYGSENVKQRRQIDIYLPDLCRSLPLEFVQESRIYGVIPAYYYEPPENVFKSGSANYCELKNLNYEQIIGVSDISRCLDEGPPVLISHPHFMEGDARLFEHIDGLKPNRSRHKSFAFVHPRLALPMHGIARMQVNLRVQSLRDHYKDARMDGLILPIAWIEITVSDIPIAFIVMLFVSSYGEFIVILCEILSISTLVLTSRALVRQKHSIEANDKR